MKDAIETALAAYERGDLRAALNILVSLGDAPTADLADPGAPALFDARIRAAEAARPIPAAALEWVSLARDRLRKELGEQDVAVVPVPLALRTALSLL